MNINVHIERLIMDGLPITGQQGPLVQAAVEAELTRLLTEHGLASSLQGGGAIPNVRTGPLQMKDGSTPAQTGRQIAGAIHGGIGW